MDVQNFVEFNEAMQSQLETQIANEQTKNARFFQQNLERIKKNYLKKYVVIKNQQIVDSGDDIARLDDLYKGQLVLITAYFDSPDEYLKSPLADWPDL